MNCTEIRLLLHAYVDDELDVVNTLEVEQHLQQCTNCIQDYKNYQAIRAAMRTGPLYFQAPEKLQKRIQSSIQKANTPHIPQALSWRWISVAAVLILTVGVLWGLLSFWSPFSDENALAQNVLASHVRSLMADHLVDVHSSDQHTVKPWFDGKLDYSPSVVDLASRGFPLMGGRLDYLDNRPVAALVYKHKKHMINLFIWPSTQGAGTGTKTSTLQGYHMMHWTKAGMTYWAVSDLNMSEFQEFVQMVKAESV